MKLWQKNAITDSSDLQKKVEKFTVGSDATWDLLLAEADVIGSMAHVEMLAEIGLLSNEEHKAASEGLQNILVQIHRGEFVIEEGVEDVHSQLELQLTASKGEVGKKIHSGRSRNDQSLLAIKLFLRKQLQDIAEKIKPVFDQLIALSEKHKNALLPGYTHFQLAMPSSFGLWFAAYAESLCDDLEMMLAAHAIVNRNPLGSAAGYGSSFPLNREFTTQYLGFESMNYNVVYAQMTRGKTEKVVAMALSTLAATLSKFSMDVCLYMNQNFAFISFPPQICTGSSIMPHKKNPDVFELIRAKCNRIQSVPNELSLLCANLPSGYHRDMQLTKECLFPALIDISDCLEMMNTCLQHVMVNEHILESKNYSNLFTVEKVNALSLQGLPFRDAYRKVAAEVEEGSFSFSSQAMKHVHEGSIGNLCNDKIVKRFSDKLENFTSKPQAHTKDRQFHL